MIRVSCLVLCSLVLFLGSPRLLLAEPPTDETPSAERGYRLLRTKAYLTSDFDQETFDRLWQVWEKPLRDEAAKASKEERRKMAYSRYGLTESPDDSLPGPTQYVIDKAGNWSMNCFACHQGKVAGREIPGVPNSRFALETLTADVRMMKILTGKKLTRMDVGSLMMPLGTTNGTSNAVMFGVILMNFRDADLNVYPDRPLPKTTHHDLDAPPWWHFQRKKRLYYDGFVQKSHRALMPFLLIKQNGPEKFRAWEKDFKDIEAWINELEPPDYPFEIDESLAEQGRAVFNRRCSSCHGTYGDGSEFPGKIVSHKRVGTDSVRLNAIGEDYRRSYNASWFAEYGKHKIDLKPSGYVAPPLDGIWASAPYLHNGSVPTLWHLFHPDQRPVVWRRREDGYDRKKIGLEIERFDELPEDAKSPSQNRQYFDTRKKGKSAAGHLFPAKLNQAEKLAVLEYLKTL